MYYKFRLYSSHALFILVLCSYHALYFVEQSVQFQCIIFGSLFYTVIMHYTG